MNNTQSMIKVENMRWLLGLLIIQENQCLVLDISKAKDLRKCDGGLCFSLISRGTYK